MEDLEETAKAAKEFFEQHQSEIVFVTFCVLHPWEYVNVLMQIGHEPLPPQDGVSLLGKPVKLLPNYFEYIQHIKETEGIIGCYRGLSARILGVLSSGVLAMEVIKRSGMDYPEIQEPPNLAVDGEPNQNDYIKYCRRLIILNSTSTVVAYPFHMVAVRMMAAFAGKEEQYSNLISAILSVYRENGILGFYYGLIPELVGSITSVTITGLLAYFVNKYVIKTKDFRKLTIPLIALFTGSISYKMKVVSSCMAVAGSSLKAGNPPDMPKYPHWISCLTQLHRNRQLGRGSSVVFRYYTGPMTD